MSFLIGMIIGGILGYLSRIVSEWDKEKCPRQIRGYNCQGEKCDHSKVAVAEAEWDMNRK